MRKLDRERLKRLVEESKSWPPWLHAIIGPGAPEKVRVVIKCAECGKRIVK